MALYESINENDTITLAANLALASSPSDIFLLHGPLGAGKSVFARAFIQTLCGAGIDVPSPTFTLVQTYDSAKATIWHFDLYRLEDSDEIYETGWEDALDGGIVLVEWPERLGHLTPPGARSISIEPLDGQRRRIHVSD